jgi:hypothetical protein
MMRFIVKRYGGASAGVFLILPDDGEVKTDMDLALVAHASYMGNHFEMVKWFGSVCEDVTEAHVRKVVEVAKVKGLWRQSEHSLTKRYFEIAHDAPTSVVVDIHDVSIHSPLTDALIVEASKHTGEHEPPINLLYAAADQLRSIGKLKQQCEVSMSMDELDELEDKR